MHYNYNRQAYLESIFNSDSVHVHMTVKWKCQIDQVHGLYGIHFY